MSLGTVDTSGAGPVSVAPKRSLGGFTADAVLSEDSVDELVMTDHPVEQGATITDHAYAEPSEINLVYGWSSASSQNVGGTPSFLQDLYARFLALQRPIPQLVNVISGKRSYANMLVRSIRLMTDKTTENALILNVRCRQVFIAQTTIVTANMDPNAMTAPQNNAPVTQRGQNALATAPNYNTQAAPPPPKQSLGPFKQSTVSQPF